MSMKSASASKASPQLNNELIPDSESQTGKTHAELKDSRFVIL